MYPNISAEMARHGMTQSELAEMLGVTRKTVNKWLNGHTSIPVECLIELKKRWSVSIDYLLDLPE